jgi:hypothetical protein
MKYKESRNQVVNDYIDSLDKDIQGLFIAVREEVLSVSNELEESIKWKDCLVYSKIKNLIQTVVGKNKISLIFFEGAQIKDNQRLLEGEGKKTRTLRIVSPDFDKETLHEYVRQAIAIGGNR